MITLIETAWEPDLWRRELSRAIRTSAQLAHVVGVQLDPVAHGLQAPDFPVLVPRGFAARMRHGDVHDPLLRQVLAIAAESQDVAGFGKDPLGETREGISTVPGLIQKYQGRALLIVTGGCAVHCRYCFRRHFPYQEHKPAATKDAVAAVARDPSITEIILSGGDPLLLEDAALAELVANLTSIPHLRRLRIHTRMPIVLPERTTQGLLDVVRTCRVPVVMVMHVNHANELNHATARALAALHNAGARLLNQAVLLNGVNADAETQCVLAEKLFDQGVLPYYLHMPDPVAGTHHFYVDDETAMSIYMRMQVELPGYLLPKLVRELPGDLAKRPLGGQPLTAWR